ncbi:TraB/GumN family protein [Flavobacterium sp. LS1R47]|uniref:TraB/GumN family protein n=1 Tax=Flavobacterium frigoritolerans TaxID=2987686 RepID=A0A9X2ZNP5_9FLAO|nr:TraB/GumN family protein [Flavobacterium frigoritolerans]MCV9931967.1 TraB/GumN family protein [Flavobacterium frigoritolerans]
MKNLFKSLAVAIAIIFCATIQAQDKSPKLENSLLWEVSGKGLSKPSYLYGTIHMICGADYFLSEKTKKAFEASDKLVLEVNLSDPNEITDMQQLAMGKEPLDKKLTALQLSTLEEILKKSTGMNVQQVNKYSLSSVMSLIFMKTYPCTDLKVYEFEFIELAKKRNFEVAGLETIKSQFETLDDAYTNDEMISMLVESVKDGSTPLVDDYKTENIEALYKRTTGDKFMNEKTRIAMLDKRNSNWVNQIPELMKKQSIFIAVGAAHLAGEQGVINLLRMAGYKVKPVMK